MRCIRPQKLRILVAVLVIGVPARAAIGGLAYPDPPGGWTYIYTGDATSGGANYTALDGAWSHNNGSDQWDESAIGTGRPGGASGITDGGKGSFSVRQSSGDDIISFTLANVGNDPLATEKMKYDPTILFTNVGGQEGLVMNCLTTGGDNDDEDPWEYDGDGEVLNQVALAVTDWHEFSITIEADTSGGGTHLVKVRVDGAQEAHEFHLTAGGDNDYDDSYIAMGLGATGAMGAIGVDFFAYKPGTYESAGGIINNPPTVNAGDDQIKWLRSSSITVRLNGEVSDDGIGDPNGYLAMEWQWVGGTGEGPILFSPGNNIEDPNITIYDFGTYELQLEATDGRKTGSDTVTITINEGLKGDLFVDNKVDWKDLMLFTRMWLDEPPSDADLVGNDRVNVIDYAVLANNWWYQTYTALVEISEFMADNEDTLLTIYEPGGEQHSPDWIEIHNLDVNTVDLTGWYVTDDKDEPNKWQLPDGFIIEGGGYRIVFASGLGDSINQFIDPYGYYHTSFQLDKGGDYLALVAPGSLKIIHEFADYEYDNNKFGFPPQEEDYSYGILDATKRYFSAPTPETENQGAFEGFVADTKFSHDRGFYDTDFFVRITTDTIGAKIRYTTDGSAPTDSHGQVYDPDNPIGITTTTTLRAAAFKAGWMPTNIDTHTYIFPDHVLAQPVLPAGYPAKWGSIDGDYQVDPDIVNHSDPCDRLHPSDLRCVPTFSLVMDYDDLFGSNQIYLYGDGQERLCSIELVYPDGTTGFQENGIVQIQGGSSTSRWKSKKLSMRYKFKECMKNGTPTGGPRKLNHQLYPDATIDRYDNIIFDAVLNNSWSHGTRSTQRRNCMFIQDQYVSDLHNAMGGNSPRGLFAHLYLNGLYWGMYYVHDRPDHAWAEEMFGGYKDQYHALKHNKVLINNGNGNSAVSNYDAMLTAATNAGNNPTNLAIWDTLCQNLDVDNLITYLLAHWFPGTSDWAGSSGKNVYYTCRDAPDGRWRHHTWDAEHTMKDSDVGFENSPHYIHNKLKNNVEYKMRFADLVHRLFFNHGVLSGLNPYNMYQARMTEIDRAIVGESARWGDAWDHPPYTRSDWLNVQAGKLGWLDNRPTYVLNDLLKPAGLYPNLDAPEFSPHGGWDLNGFTLTMTKPAAVYYTLDGADPRLPGGAVNTDHAKTYSTAINLTNSTHVKARAKSGSTWSALNEAVFAVGPVAESLRITEIMYHPKNTGDVNDPNEEYIELKNMSGETININLVKFTNGIDFTFPSWELGKKNCVLVVKDRAAFDAQYPGLSSIIAGEYAGSLDNGGERIELADAVGRTIQDFKYGDDWRPITDGEGFSLTIIDPANADPNSWGEKDSWRASAYNGGSPGSDDSGILPDPGAVAINEVLAHSPGTPGDWIELYNTTDAQIDIGGWYLSNSNANLMKYRIADGTKIDADEYLVFYEDANFGEVSTDPGKIVGFALSENESAVYLSSAEGDVLMGYREAEDFGASATGVSFGRYFKRSTGNYNFVAMSAATPWLPNAYPKVGPIVINEIMYNPQSGDQRQEYIELHNIGPIDVPLYDSDADEPWKFTDGIDYTFPVVRGIVIPAGGYLLVVKDMTAYLAEYGLPPSGVPVLGLYDGNLSNGGEKLELSMPGDVDNDDTRYYIRVDRVNYSDGSHPEDCPGGVDLWPTEPDAGGKSLTRTIPANYGNDPNNWIAAMPSPGTGSP